MHIKSDTAYIEYLATERFLVSHFVRWTYPVEGDERYESFLKPPVASRTAHSVERLGAYVRLMRYEGDRTVVAL
jgi:hypothetical protein